VRVEFTRIAPGHYESSNGWRIERTGSGGIGARETVWSIFPSALAPRGYIGLAFLPGFAQRDTLKLAMAYAARTALPPANAPMVNRTSFS
jgi:hypothetical protein